VVQDTGIGGSFPIGCGLLVFSDEDEAVAALADVEQSYAEHCQAARELAQIYFDARIVLNRLLDVCGL
jgi:hypothetical protein